MQSFETLFSSDRHKPSDTTSLPRDLTFAGLVILMLTSLALFPAPSFAQKTDADPGAKDAIDEIVVTVDRRGERGPSLEDVLGDPLVRRIQRELRELRVLEIESEWRSEVERIQAEPPRIRWGYDPRVHLRAAVPLPQPSLPLDLMQAATVFSVGF